MYLGCLLYYSVLCGSLVSGWMINDQVYTLDIVHYNDFHDRFEETSVDYSVCNSNSTNCIGGFARLYYEIKSILNKKPNALILDAGDTFQGTYWYTLLKWNVTQKFINLLPNDVHTVGNHEFDDGVEGLAPYLAALKAPVVVANIDTSKEPSLEGLYKPYVILERKGRKIGIIGLITAQTKTSSNPRNVIFLDPVTAAKREAQKLTDMGVNIIIILSHCGLEVDKEIAREVGENIDIIVGGHSHSLLLNGDSPTKEPIDGPYPTVVESAHRSGHKVLIVTASAYTKYLGDLSVYFNRNGDWLNYDGNAIFLNGSIPEDTDMKTLLQPYKEELHRLVNEVMGYTNDNLLADTCGLGECTIGDLTADAFWDAAEKLHVTNLTHVSFLLRSMIRGSIAKGNITRGTVINALPFSNKLVTFTLSGKYLLLAIERCLLTYWQPKPFNGPLMPQVSGLKITLDGMNRKVVSVLAKEGDKFLPVEEDKDYQVTTLDFLTRGGSGYTMLKENARNLKFVGVDSEVFIEYVKKNSPIKQLLDKRLTVLN